MKLFSFVIGMYVGYKLAPKLNGVFLKSGFAESRFSNEDIQEGVSVELEHTDSLTVAKRIALDHLTEDVNYYRKLKSIHG